MVLTRLCRLELTVPSVIFGSDLANQDGPCYYRVRIRAELLKPFAGIV